MKKIIFSVVAALTIAFTACSGDSEIKKMVSQMKDLCPYSMGEWMALDDVEYDNQTVTMTYSVKEGLLDFDGIRANEEAFRNNMLMSYANNSEKGFKDLIEAIVKAEANLRVVLNSETGDSHTLQFSSDELKANMPGEDSDPEVLLKTMVDNTHLQTPMVVEEGLIMTDMTLDEKYCTYVYSCDEDYYDMDMISENYETIKSNMLTGLAGEDAMVRRICDLVVLTNRGLAFKYVGATTGKTSTIYIESNEM